jgi:hypothetical protein
MSAIGGGGFKANLGRDNPWNVKPSAKGNSSLASALDSCGKTESPVSAEGSKRINTALLSHCFFKLKQRPHHRWGTGSLRGALLVGDRGLMQQIVGKNRVGIQFNRHQQSLTQTGVLSHLTRSPHQTPLL